MRLRWIIVTMVVLVVVVAGGYVVRHNAAGSEASEPAETGLPMNWHAPDTAAIPRTPAGNLVRYGRALIANTAHYLGPKGTVAKISNAMNCQNCHLDAGARLYGNSFLAVASTYPVFRARSGVVESISFRINDCFQRSMNGQPLDTGSREMHAMVAFLKWIGKDVQKGTRPKGAGIADITNATRAADPLRGKIVYQARCQVCHGKKGDGIWKSNGAGFVYPPLWGPQSYNTGAGLYRLGRFAGFVKFSMPFGTSFEAPQLSDDEAWDVAAYVNSQQRPQKTFLGDWPDIRKKSVDYPVGPFADRFSESQHKYGPFGPIKAAQDSQRQAER